MAADPGGDVGTSRHWSHPAALVGATLLALAALLPAQPAAAAGSGQFKAGPQDISAGALISPGDWIASGWSLQVPSSRHPSMTIHLRNLAGTFAVSCGKHRTQSTLRLSLPDADISVGSGDRSWVPTDASDAAASYQFSMQMPDVCSGRSMAPINGAGGGVTYTGTLLSDDTADPIAIRFHTVDANSLAGQNDQGTNINCASPDENPSGGSQCDGTWSAPATITAASFAPPASGPAPGGSGSGTATPGSGSTPGSGAIPGSGTTVPRSGGLPVVLGNRGSTPVGVGLPGAALQSPGLSPDASPAADPGTQPRSLPNDRARLPINSILGPVPILVPNVPDSVVRAGASLPWNWFMVLGAVDLLLIALILVRRHRGGALR